MPSKINLKYAFSFGMFMALLFGFLLSEAHPGWFIVEQKTDAFGNFGMQSTIISGAKVRIEHQTSTFIFDVDNHITTVILPRHQVYWRGHHDSLGIALFRQLEIQTELLIAQLQDIEREKAKAELDLLMQLMRSSQPDSLLTAHFHIQPADSLKEISGYLCRKYILLVDSVAVEEIWVTNAVKPWATVDLRRLNQMMKLFNKPNLYSAYRMSEEWLEMLGDGMLMRSIAPSNLGNSIMEVSVVRELEVRDDVFSPPDEYRKAGTAEMINILMGGADAIVAEPKEPGMPKLPVKPRSNTSIDPY